MTPDELYYQLADNNIFLSGGAGVGKSYLTAKIIELYKEEGKSVIPLGPTGISAVNIGGYTLHSFFVFGIASTLEELRLQDRKNSSRLSELKKVLQNLDLIIIDEISMVSADLMDMIYYRLEQLGFQGTLMVVGDFYQLPPIVKHQRGDSLFKESFYAFESSAWSMFKFKPIILEEIKRTKDREFAEILSFIRRGEVTIEVREYLNMLLKNNFRAQLDPTYLFGCNREVEQMNREKLALIDADEALYFWQIEKLRFINDNRIDSWSKALPVVESLHLKIGAPVIFTVNKWGKFVNGQRGVVVGLEADHIVVRSEERDITLYRHDFELTELNKESLESEAVAVLEQFPIKLAYAITIHKSQGMSLESMVCNVDSLFVPGQFYVAISRAINPKQLRIEYNGNNFNSYIDRVIVQNSDVDNFYKDFM